MEMAVLSGRDVKPLLLKLGIALALSIAGYYAAHRRSRRRPSPASSFSVSVWEPKASSMPFSNGGLKDELRILGSEEGFSKLTTTTSVTRKSVVGFSPFYFNTGDEEEFLLPKSSHLILKELEVSAEDPGCSPSLTPRSSYPNEDCLLMEQEVSHFKNLAFSPVERERNLEFQPPEYYELLEGGTATRELENQLKVISMEAQLLSLKTESLLLENQQLQSLVLDHSRVMSELEAAKGKIKVLKMKVKLDEEQAREKISSLHQMIGVLQEREQKHEAYTLEMECKLKRLMELEEESGSLERRNSNLAEENLQLKQKVESSEMIAMSAIEGHKAEELGKIHDLKQSNDKLQKEAEQLQINCCSDAEELVYLRWVNACLRHELRYCQPPRGMAAARNLSKNLSPRSEEKAKQLILEYTNLQVDHQDMSPGDLDDYSSSHASTGESDDISLEAPSHGTHKSKFFSKLKKLVLGKDHRSHRVFSVDKTPSWCGDSVSDVGRDSFDSSSSMAEEIGAVNQSLARPRKSFVDLQRLRRVFLKGRERKKC